MEKSQPSWDRITCSVPFVRQFLGLALENHHVIGQKF